MFVEFDADFPDDAIWDERQVLVQPGGRSIAVWLADELHRICGTGLGVEQHEHFGWDFFVQVGTSDIFCLLQLGAPWILSFEASTITKLFHKNYIRELSSFARILHAILSSDKRISNVRWYKRDDYKSTDRLAAANRPSNEP